MICSACSERLPDRARFCPSCGTRAGFGGVEERRVVTVLFADVAGFTALSERKDPETVKDLLDQCFGALVPVIERHGGHVDKIIGDEIMAVFGAPRATEDDPERAVRSALGLAEALGRLDLDVTLRVGVNTGEVLAGPVGPGGAYTVTGDTVNTAHRLVSTAEPGEILVGERTWESTRDAFEFAAMPPRVLRGKAEPVRFYAALQPLRPPGERPAIDLTAPFKGRDRELAALLAEGDQVFRTRIPRVVVIIGDAGAGKTRLALEFQLALWRENRDTRLLWARCPPYGEAGTTWPIAELVRGVLNMGHREDLDRIEDLVQRLRPLVAGQGVDVWPMAHSVFRLLGLARPMDPNATDPAAGHRVAGPLPPDSTSLDQLLGVAGLVIAAAADEAPLSIVVDDAQWADEAVLAWLERLPRQTTGRPVVCTVITRTDPGSGSEATDAAWRRLRNPQTDITIGPLELDVAGDLVTDLTRQFVEPGAVFRQVGPEARRQIAQLGEGNPFLLTELVHYLLERQLLVGDEEGQWRLATPMDRLELPDGVRSLLTARLDALPADERAFVLDAAVLGRIFSPEMVAAIGDHRDVAHLTQELVRRGILDLAADWLPGAAAFEHVLFREVAYASVPIGERTTKHLAAARWLEATFDLDRTPDAMAAVAYHYERAVVLSRSLEHTDPGFTAPAFGFLIRAARDARSRDALGEAERFYRHAREIGSPDPDESARVAVEHGMVLAARGRVDPALEAFDAAVDAGSADATVTATAWAHKAAVLRTQGEVVQSDQLFDDALRLLRDQGAIAGQAAVLRLVGLARLQAGRPRDALPRLLQALDLEESVESVDPQTLQALGWCELLVGDGESARIHLWAAGERYGALGDVSGMGWCLGILGFVFQREGRIDQARAIASSLVDQTRRLGDPWAEAMSMILLSLCAIEEIDTEAAGVAAGSARALLEELGDEWGLAMASFAAGSARADAGDPDGAQAILRAGLEHARSVHYTGEECRLLTALAGLEFLYGNPESAEATARSALTLIRGGAGDFDSEVLCRCVLASAAIRGGDVVGAQVLAEETVIIADTAPERLSAAYARIVLCYARLAAGRVDEALVEAQIARDGAGGSLRVWGRAMAALAAAHEARGDHGEAMSVRNQLADQPRALRVAFGSGSPASDGEQQ